MVLVQYSDWLVKILRHARKKHPHRLRDVWVFYSSAIIWWTKFLIGYWCLPQNTRYLCTSLLCSGLLHLFPYIAIFNSSAIDYIESQRFWFSRWFSGFQKALISLMSELLRDAEQKQGGDPTNWLKTNAAKAHNVQKTQTVRYAIVLYDTNHQRMFIVKYNIDLYCWDNIHFMCSRRGFVIALFIPGSIVTRCGALWRVVTIH